MNSCDASIQGFGSAEWFVEPPYDEENVRESAIVEYIQVAVAAAMAPAAIVRTVVMIEKRILKIM
jgi:hypothetical protein